MSSYHGNMDRSDEQPQVQYNIDFISSLKLNMK